MTPDAMPIIGPADSVKGLYVIGGFSGHGFQHSPAAGRLLAETVVAGKPHDFDLSPFSLARFQSAIEREINVV
jgi:sarcosine oxidase subunit beta